MEDDLRPRMEGTPGTALRRFGHSKTLSRGLNALFSTTRGYDGLTALQPCSHKLPLLTFDQTRLGNLCTSSFRGRCAVDAQKGTAMNNFQHVNLPTGSSLTEFPGILVP